MRYQAVLVALAGVCASATAQMAPPRFDHVELSLDSGAVGSAETGSAFSGLAETPGSDWIRLYFGEMVLPDGAELLVTSVADGATQRLNRETLAQWHNSSAFFVGDAVYVDLIVPPGETGRVEVVAADAGLPPLEDRTICGSTDDRQLSNDPRAGRLSNGCTAWLFSNRPNGAMTADHCGPPSGALWFNVPLRTSSGGTVPPHPNHQYSIDTSSINNTGPSSVGNDWSVFGCFPNSNTGLSMVDAQMASYVMATQAPPNDGRGINITGYGSTSSPVPSSWYGVQKTHDGTLYTITGTTLRYRTDTTGGNSGSCVYDLQDERAIGVHTHGGCSSSSSSSNQGTSINNTGWRNAIMQARGVQGGPIGAVIRPLGDSMPDRVDPAGGTTVGVELVADFLHDAPQQGVTLHSNDGSGWVETAMSAGFGGDWFAGVPATECGSTVRMYFSAIAADGSTVTFPPSAPTIAFEATSSEPWDYLADSDFESDDGWTVSSTAGTVGPWERGVPSATDRRGGPNQDADGSGSCWTTGLGLNVDLDSGTTTLTSPVFDLSGAADPRVDMAVWHNSDGSSERVSIEFSDDGGSSWTQVESLASTWGWRDLTYRVADEVSVTGSFRVRLTASDTVFEDVIEAGLDAFAIRDVVCSAQNCNDADLAEPFGVLDLADVQAFITAFLGGDPVADLAEPFGVFDLADVQAFLVLFNQGCP